ncbi:hypothetical protein N7491_003456 [Penicillium cf. griseofulvum]|uniref:Uncharacterized protein n=1 Tax=Penicillium cf. griseofulvum TaxID=2972120 RepID=A0A9W9MR74_9EURO|nr:hypothetical protein N7472_002368 [Penicillium cf. griseofulvum]KAJ5441050.1 hypothetical protein N7491_003456 [Penicillium cf. griseofulvum]KAJ5449097.1 hypothetical protein N7445_003918 [Penicillium cf. griseofulvum]
MLSPVTLKYGRRQAIGRLLQQWIECPESDPSVKVCPILPSTLNFKDLQKSKDLEIDMEIHPYIPLQIEDDFAELEIMGPTGGAWEKMTIDQPDAPPDTKYSDIHIWEGQVAPGVLMVEEIKKAPGFFMSEVCQAIYQKHFPIDTLKYVYLIDVINKDTRTFVRDELYTEFNGLAWPDGKVRDWISGTPEFEALLGTTLGGTVGRLILGAFKRGTRRISRIRIFHSFDTLQMRFAIEEIEQFIPTCNSQYPSDCSVESTDSTGPETRSASRRRQTLELRKRKLDWDEETESKRLRREY